MEAEEKIRRTLLEHEQKATAGETNTSLAWQRMQWMLEKDTKAANYRRLFWVAASLLLLTSAAFIGMSIMNTRQEVVTSEEKMQEESTTPMPRQPKSKPVQIEFPKTKHLASTPLKTHQKAVTVPPNKENISFKASSISISKMKKIASPSLLANVTPIDIRYLPKAKKWPQQDAKGDKKEHSKTFLITFKPIGRNLPPESAKRNGALLSMSIH